MTGWLSARSSCAFCTGSAPSCQRPGAAGPLPEIRFPHLQIWGNVVIDGIRLTALADGANLGLAATSELVNEFPDLSYLERRPDPTDSRAKLIYPTPAAATS